MKKMIPVKDIGSTYTYEKNGVGKAIYKTLDKGQYAISAKHIVLENLKTGEVVKLNDATGIKSQDLFKYDMLIPLAKLDATLPGRIGEYFRDIGFDRKAEWVVTYKEV